MAQEADDIRVDVLVVGAGPAGGAMAALLATYGVSALAISKHPRTALTPRAHVTNQRALEVARDLGLEEECLARAMRGATIANALWLESLAGEEYARAYAFGQDPARKGDYEGASPSPMADLPQSLLEPILIDAATARGARVRFDTELLDFAQDEAGVTSLVRDRVTGHEVRVRSRYLVGADGGRSRVAERLGIRMIGRGDLVHAVNVQCSVDLRALVEHRPGVLYWILDRQAPPWAFVANFRMVRPWHRWLVTFISAEAAPATPSPAAIEERLRALIGVPGIPLEVHSTSRWSINDLVAESYGRGRVFCVGDAVHRHPPGNGLGSNTSIQDSYNLAWKLALVLSGKAAPALLATYEAERLPVGRQVVRRANRSMDHAEVFDLLGVDPRLSAAERAARLALLAAATDEGKRRRAALRDAVAQRCYELQANGVELNQRYASRAVVGDGTADPGFARDAELYYAPSTRPGAHLPHAWIGGRDAAGAPVSTLDLAGRGGFALFTGVGGDAWAAAARTVAERTGVPIAVRAIGPGLAWRDLYGRWAALAEIEDDGCLLVRPDMFVGWRSRTLAADCEGALGRAMARILGHDAGADAGDADHQRAPALVASHG